MPRVVSLTRAENADVYNMTVKNTHNFSVNGGLIVHNCDALRYFAVYWTRPNETPESRNVRKVIWTDDIWQDYYGARSKEEREYIIKRHGNPF